MDHETLDRRVLARLDRVPEGHDFGRRSTVRLVEAVQRVATSWVEAVAVTKAVCERLGRSEMPPAIGDLRLHASGHVSFPPGGIADEDVAIQAVARLLNQLTGDAGCPFEVWEAIERAQVAPMTFRSAREFGASLQSVSERGTRACVAAYVRDLHARPAAAMAVADRGLARHWSSAVASAVVARLPGWTPAAARKQWRRRSA